LENEPDEIVKRGGAKYRQFLTEQHVSRLRGRLKDAQVTYDGVLSYGFEQGAYFVLIKFSIQLDDRDYTPGVVAGLLGESLNNKPYVRAIDYRIDMRGGSAPGGEWKGRQWWVKMVHARELAQ
jgi:hypothetical protein